MFHTVLVANRGEIAVRIMATLRALGIRPIAVYSDADAHAPHVRAADAAVRLGPAPAAVSYLAAERVLDAAARHGAQAIHPGYGFLSENAAFARACADAGVVFVGPPPAAIEAMGDKIRAKVIAEATGVPVVPGMHAPDMDDAALAAAAGAVGYPLLVKAAAGGGGKGMRLVLAHEDLAEALAASRREAQAAFDDDALLLERYLLAPRHVEVQVFADTHGGIVHLGERECSLQRRHQKVVEECPASAIDEDTRGHLTTSAVAVAAACGYVGAGTVEFLASGVGGAGAPECFFLEMNTRLQVEHRVTEAVYGVDLVEWQLRIAAGEPLPCTQEQLAPHGHAMQARVYAEDPGRGFLPTGGTVLRWSWPRDSDVRVDTGVEQGTVVGSVYDPLLAKVVAWAPERETARRRLRHHLDVCPLLGVVTNQTFLTALLDHPDVVAGTLDTALVERAAPLLVDRTASDAVIAAAGLARLVALAPKGPVVDPFELPGGWRIGEHAWARWRIRAGARVAQVAVRGAPAAAEVRVDQGAVLPAAVRLDGAFVHVRIAGEELTWTTAAAGSTVWLAAPGQGVWALVEEHELVAARRAEDPAAGGPLLAPMPGTVSAVRVAQGDAVRAGQTLVIVEAMKMEHHVTARVDGTVTTVAVRSGDTVGMDQLLAVVAPRQVRP